MGLTTVQRYCAACDTAPKQCVLALPLRYSSRFLGELLLAVPGFLFPFFPEGSFRAKWNSFVGRMRYQWTVSGN